MILLKSLQLKNLLSHKDTTIEFDETFKISLEGASGNGKSAIVESIVWALYGSGRADNRSIIRYSEKSASVVLFLTKDDVLYRIERSINLKGKHELKVFSGINKDHLKPIKTNGVRETQDHLENEILNSSYELFVNSIVYPQDAVDSFIKQTAAKRKDILLEIAKASSYDEYYKKTSEVISEDSTILTTLETKLEYAKDIIKDNKDSAEKFKDLSEELYLNKLEEGKLKLKIEAISKEYLEMSLKDNEIKQLKDKTSGLKEKIEIEQNLLESINEEVGSLNSKDVGDLKKIVEDLDLLKVKLDGLRKVESEYASWNKKMMDIVSNKPMDLDYQKEIDSLNKDIVKLMSDKVMECPDLKKPCTYYTRINEERANSLAEVLMSKEEQLAKYNKDVEKYNKDVDELGESPDIESTSLIPNFSREIEEKEKLKQEIEIFSNNRENKLLSLTKDRSSHIKSLNDSSTEYNSICEKLKELEAEILKFTDIDEKKSSYDNDLSLISDKILKNTEMLSKSESSVKITKEKKTEITSLNKKIKALREKLDNLKLLKGAFSPTGIKTIIIDYIIPRLEDKINSILSELSNFRIKLNTQKSTVDGEKVMEGLFITVLNERSEEFPFESYSGGEKIKINVSIFEGLASLQQFGFRIFDETVIGLDNDTIENFSKIILDFKDKIDQIMCISHIQSVKDLFDDKIEVLKNNGISYII